MRKEWAILNTQCPVQCSQAEPVVLHAAGVIIKPSPLVYHKCRGPFALLIRFIADIPIKIITIYSIVTGFSFIATVCTAESLYLFRWDCLNYCRNCISQY